MTYEKIKPTQTTHLGNFSIEEVILHMERVTNGDGTPYSEQPFSDAPPGVIKTIIRRFSFDETIANPLKSRLKLCDCRMEYIVQPCWHQGYDASASLMKHCQLSSDVLRQTGHIEAMYLYPADKAHWYWFLAGWLSACRVS